MFREPRFEGRALISEIFVRRQIRRRSTPEEEQTPSQAGGATDLILRERRAGGVVQGLSRDYWTLQLRETAPLAVGSEVALRVTGMDTHDNDEGVLFAEVAHA